MQTTSPVLGRPADRSNFIVNELRGQIVRGFLSPGSQLPTRVEIEKQYSASTVTVQRALETLRQDGFVQVNGRQGTFVSENPPHLTRYALLFPSLPDGVSYWVRFWTALTNEALKQQSHNCKLPVYYGISALGGGEDYERLVADVRAHRVAGLIFASSPHQLLETPLMEEADMPRVAIMSAGGAIKVPRVSNDVPSFFQKALDYLQARGRRKIGFLNPAGLDKVMEVLVPQLAGQGFISPPIWQHSFHTETPYAARHVAQLLMHSGQSERPDGLIISDDNLFEHVIAGLIAAGVRVPEDVEIVAHCNFPYQPPSVVPAKRLGFDARQMLRTCIECIDAQRRGEEVPEFTTLSAVFEDELTT